VNHLPAVVRLDGMYTAATPPVAGLEPWPVLDQRLHALFQEMASAVAVSPGHAARLAVRRRTARLDRRRRLRHAVGSSALAAGVVASGLQVRNAVLPAPTARPAGGASSSVPRRATPPPLPPTGATSPPSTSAQPTSPPPTSPPPTSPISIAAATSWTWDPQEGIDREAAAPAAIFAGDRFLLYTTSATHCIAGTCDQYWVPRFTGPDLARPGRLDGDAMPSAPAWVAGDDRAIWAPSVARIGDRYVLYFAATSAQSAAGAPMKCLGAAVSPVPEGPFEPLPDPLRCTPGHWVIDPYPTFDGTDWYLLWRQDDPAHITGRIVAAPLRPDGLALAGSEPTTLLDGEFAWEDGYPRDGRGIGPIENPAMTRHPVTGEWLLAWSANRWETQAYATGLAACEGPIGPCRRLSRETPWVRTGESPGITTTAELGGAGGLSFVVGPDGRLYAVLHAYSGGGQAPEARRVGWAYRVEADATSGQAYRLTEIHGNHSADASVNGA
jgi:Glycosyl hydrolases family 43